ncbi:hypothetical protein ABZ341_31395 [Streptomyces sp. NPDC006173]|uniref:hypothetical protein n=1 Tax=Streptomyces sp. NPDC006173 TaxID=3155349 RepID=UPI0033D75ABB
MYTRQPTTAELARTARDMVAQLERATGQEPRALTVSRVHDTTMALAELVEMLPRTLERLAAALQMRAEESASQSDGVEGPRAAAYAATGALSTAGQSAQNLARQLGETCSQMKGVVDKVPRPRSRA